MKRTETVIETHEVWIIRRRSSNQARAFCAQCPEQPEMLTAEEAASLCGQTLRSIFRLVEAGLVHFRESPGGEVFICPASFQPQPARDRRAQIPPLHLTALKEFCHDKY
jgi:hypothetical protein